MKKAIQYLEFRLNDLRVKRENAKRDVINAVNNDEPIELTDAVNWYIKNNYAIEKMEKLYFDLISSKDE